MTLNCDLPLDFAREEFAKLPNDGTARDYVEAAFEYWCVDNIGDHEFAADLRKVAEWLESKPRP